MRLSVTEDEFDYIIDNISENEALVKKLNEQVEKERIHTSSRQEIMEKARLEKLKKMEVVRDKVFEVIREEQEKGIHGDKRIPLSIIQERAEIGKNSAIKYRKMFYGEA